MISDLSPFRVVLTFDYGLGFESTDHSSPLNGAYFSEYTFSFNTNYCCICTSTDTSTLVDARK